MTVYFIGAGPGDPDLITLKGQRLIDACKVCLYAGSLLRQRPKTHMSLILLPWYWKTS